MRQVTWRVYGKPIAKGRPRYSGKSDTWYTPGKTGRQENKIARVWLDESNDKFSGPLEVEMVFAFAMPKSTSKRMRERLVGRERPKKPDIDNLVKTVLDGCNGVVYRDDAQICRISARKIYGNEDYTEITVREIDDLGCV